MSAGSPNRQRCDLGQVADNSSNQRCDQRRSRRRDSFADWGQVGLRVFQDHDRAMGHSDDSFGNRSEEQVLHESMSVG